MTTTVSLVLFGTMLGAVGPRVLARCNWPTRSPFWGIVAWQAVTVSVFVSFVWAGLTLAAHAVPAGGLVGRVVHACSTLLAENGATKEGPLLPITGAVVAAGFTFGLLFAAHAGWRRHREHVRRQHALLGVLCVPHRDAGVVVLDHQDPVVFCVPGRSGRVVASRGALDVLSESQWRQVLAHERAHLAARHHVVLRWADAFATVFRGRLGSALAQKHIAELIEMHADDAAGSRSRRDLAEAVVALAGGATPAGALGAGGSALPRVQRLVSPVAPLSRATRTTIGLGLAALVAAPLVLATLPGLASLFMQACPFFF